MRVDVIAFMAMCKAKCFMHSSNILKPTPGVASKAYSARYFIEHELFESCFMYPDPRFAPNIALKRQTSRQDREILAYVPPTMPGGFKDQRSAYLEEVPLRTSRSRPYGGGSQDDLSLFKKIACRMRRAGFDLTQEGPPIDICKEVFPPPGAIIRCLKRCESFAAGTRTGFPCWRERRGMSPGRICIV